MAQKQKSVVTLTADSNKTDLFDIVVRSDLICDEKNDTKLLTLNNDEHRRSVAFEIRRIIEKKENSTEVVGRLADDTCHR